MKLTDIRDEYLEYSRHFKTPGSYRFDQSHLTMITDYLLQEGYVESKELTFQTLYDFIDYSRKRKNSNNTINKRIMLLKRAIMFQVKKKTCNPTVIASFPKLKTIDKRYNLVNEDQMIQIINYLLETPDTGKYLRNKTIVFLFIDTGMRLSELTYIKTENIDLSNDSILLEHTKNGRERTVYFSKVTRKYLMKYLKEINDESEYVFRSFNYPDQPLTYFGILQILHRIRDDLGLKKLSSHMIRHSYGTLAYKLDISTLFTKNTMGHANIEMTERYTHYDTETNRKVYNKLSPMNYYLKKIKK